MFNALLFLPVADTLLFLLADVPAPRLLVLCCRFLGQSLALAPCLVHSWPAVSDTLVRQSPQQLFEHIPMLVSSDLLVQASSVTRSAHLQKSPVILELRNAITTVTSFSHTKAP